ncbi:MAG TPA: cysteine--tRNA ligase [Candidatus Saccharimonadales bacterium]|nr:cysteine--tRNA ligase [Candidatus Saccharimonadales bacterium]
MTLKFHNTLTKKTDDFTPITEGKVTLYTCGPTVYDRLHVGNWAAYIYWDTLVRTLIANGYSVERVMNITDVGHLVSDADEGEDKLEKGAKREGKTAWDIAEFYAEDFLAGMEKMGLIMPEHVVRATEFIPQQLDLVRKLKEKGYTYQIDDGIYFDTSKFPTYADFAGLDLEAQKAGARVAFNAEKRNPSDFALWKFTPSGEKRDMEWETPADLLEVSNSSTGQVMGFPGWHLECSAMAMSILGQTIDIHTGGIDHIPVHHTNEIAQSEAVSGQPFAHYWLHNNHLKVDGTKISKSLGNGFTLQDLAEKGFSPLDYRMFVLQGQYSNEGNFTFENLAGARNRLHHWRNVAALRHQAHDTLKQDKAKETDPSLAVTGLIKEALSDDLNTPEALRVVDEAFSHLESHSPDRIDRHALMHLLEAIDELLGLQLLATTPDIDDDTKQLIVRRERARDEKDWQTSDELRDELKQKGLVVRDTSDGTLWEYA